MEPRIEIITEKKLVGKRAPMSLLDNKTLGLWQSFMPGRKEIKNSLTNDLISMRVYDNPLVLGDLNQKFEKWAAIEVTDFENVPNEMETFVLNGGLYAVFHYQGLNTDNRIFLHIFGTWLPNAGYDLDNRPHFEILGEKYKNNDSSSEEEIWIPIKSKDALVK
jgi:AraC family transcriptional regulator